MNQKPILPPSFRGAVDLSKLGTNATPGGGATGGVTQVVMDVTDATFRVAAEQSMTVPVVVDLWADWCQPCKTLGPLLERLATEADGAWLLAKVDVETNPQLSQAFGARSIPTVVGLVKGQLVPLFTGALPEDQVRQYLRQLLALAKENGVTGRLALAGLPSEDAEAPLPPLHQEAYDAIERGDFDAAADAYRRAVAEHPSDSLAKAGLAQVGLLGRTTGVDLVKAREAAAQNPDDIDAQMLVADLDIAGGHVDDAFARMLDLVRATSGTDRDKVRTRLLDLFEVVGQDERVTKARRSLASALF